MRAALVVNRVNGPSKAGRLEVKKGKARGNSSLAIFSVKALV
jgi:hypothetical protein